MHQYVDKCTKSKSIALFTHVLEQLEYWDLGVIDLLREGIPLVGLQEAPKGYVKNLVPASITEDELMASALWRRRALMCDHRERTSEEQKALLDTTAEEVKMGFLEGPYNEEEMSVLLETNQWSLNPRFVLFQGSSRKVRIIDDAKKSCVNEAFSSTVKLQLQDVDYVASMITSMAKEASSRGIALDLKGKTFDLSKAYKQLAVRPDHHKHAIVGFPIDGKWRFYRSISLPFGCARSVYGFVRISQALWYVITRLLHCVCSHYFDDYPVVETTAGCKVLSSAISAVIDILGWSYAKEGDKAFPFAAEFDVLGVTFNLDGISGGALIISNKHSRIEKLLKMIDDISRRGFISYAQACELQGLLNFAVGYFSGRSLKHLVSAFVPLTGERFPSSRNTLTSLCAYAKAMVSTLPSRKHDVNGTETPVIIFTDGAWEQEQASAGAVIIDGVSRKAYVVSVPDSLVSHWLEEAGDQIISQIELWAFVVVKWCLKKSLCHHRVIAWIDNEAARACAIKANSPSPTMKSLARILSDIDVSYPTMSWFERVCSFSNPADLPSRGRISEAVTLYKLTDAGILSCNDDFVSRLMQLTQDPYQVAPTQSGANN